MTLLAWLLFGLLAAAAVLAQLSWVTARHIGRAVPPPGRFIEVGGERLHYRDLGRGPPIVLVHGLSGNLNNFNYLPLEDLARHWRLVLLDRPGAGHSPRADEGQAGIAAQARLVGEFIQAMHFKRPPLLVGHSLGGAIALSLALQQPQAVAGLALVAPLTHFIPDPPPPFRPMAVRSRWLRRLFAQALAVPLGLLGTRAVLHYVFGPEPAPRDFLLRGGGLLGLRPDAFYAAATDMCAVEDDLPAQQERYGELKLPVHVLYGDADRILDWQVHGQGLHAKVPGSHLKVLPGRGHMLPVTAALETAGWVGDVAREVFPPSPATPAVTAGNGARFVQQ